MEARGENPKEGKEVGATVEAKRAGCPADDEVALETHQEALTSRHRRGRKSEEKDEVGEEKEQPRRDKRQDEQENRKPV